MIIRPQDQVLSDRDPAQRAWRYEAQQAFTRWVFAHGRAPTNHIEYVQAILFITKALYDKFGGAAP
jgi:hypothetical protein